FADDFSGDASRWTGNGTGDWGVVDGAYVQADTGVTNPLVTAGDPTWRDVTFSVKATKRSGSEGFLIPFAVNGGGNPFWWNLGGWNNTRSA
ncbi:alpha-N-arabinofuranosidase, partial [Saccharothrix sp. MB29]|nr:alpha-N-arabinofuranosidase [Saccharothrix sp. MB29]